MKFIHLIFGISLLISGKCLIRPLRVFTNPIDLHCVTHSLKNVLTPENVLLNSNINLCASSSLIFNVSLKVCVPIPYNMP